MRISALELKIGDFITVDVGYGHPMDALVEVTRLTKRITLFNQPEIVCQVRYANTYFDTVLYPEHFVEVQRNENM